VTKLKYLSKELFCSDLDTSRIPELYRKPNRLQPTQRTRHFLLILLLRQNLLDEAMSSQKRI